jgi:threonine synthase
LEHLFQAGRGITICVNHLSGLGTETVAEDSSGNAGSSMAAYTAAAGIHANIYVPNGTAPAKVNQIRV